MVTQGASQGATKDCVFCGKPMPASAIYCTECENFQGGGRRIRFAKETLPMIVALVAVVGTVAPPILKYFDIPESTLVVSEVASSRIGVTNLGDAPGVVNSIMVHWGIDDMPMIAGSGGGGPVSNIEDPVVRPGETRWFDLELPPTLRGLIDFSKQENLLDMPCEIHVVTTTARGVQGLKVFPQRTCGVLLNAVGPNDRNSSS